MNYQNYQNLMLLTSSDTKRTLCIYSCLQIPPRENWFQYVRRVYATAINFPCIITLVISFGHNVETEAYLLRGVMGFRPPWISKIYGFKRSKLVLSPPPWKILEYAPECIERKIFRKQFDRSDSIWYFPKS